MTNHDFFIRAFEIHQWTQAESVKRCSTLTCHWCAKLTPFNNALSSAMLMCYTLFARHNLHTYSITDLSASIVTLVARELVFTQAVNSYLFTHQSLLMGSPHCTLASISTSILESVVHFIIPASHNFVGTMFHICCRHNEPITDREITNKFSTHREDCQLHHNRWELWSASTSCPT